MAEGAQMLGTTGLLDRRIERRAVAVLAAVLVAAALAVAGAPGGAASAAGEVRVLVGASPGHLGAAAAAVEAAGGHVDRSLAAVGTLVARVPDGTAAALARHPAVTVVERDRSLRVQHSVDGYDPAAAAGSMFNVAAAVGAPAYWRAGYTGAGVDVAVIDTGVARVAGLDGPGKVVDGPDLSFTAGDELQRHTDAHGHGTHLAGIIAGDDGGTDTSDHHAFRGIAPGARLVNVKVADAEGDVDVSQVIAAIDWVVQHRSAGGLDIRVLSLAFGTDSTQAWQVDPLAYAVEVAWRNGIVVVVAGGNDGRPAGPLRDPASSPWPLAVGAADTKGTTTVDDDTVPAFSNRGDSRRDPDLVAPGVSVVGLRVPGSTVEQNHPAALEGDRFLRGTGTSQATAVVAGAAALVIQQRPAATPEDVRAVLTASARRIPMHGRTAQGAGLVALDVALTTPTPAVKRTLEAGTGDGSLELSRGSVHVSRSGEELTGERDIFGSAFDSASWARMAAAGSSWSGDVWNGSTWSGSSWSGSTWSGSTWSGSTWSGSTWSGWWQ